MFKTCLKTLYHNISSKNLRLVEKNKIFIRFYLLLVSNTVLKYYVNQISNDCFLNSIQN